MNSSTSPLQVLNDSRTEPPTAARVRRPVHRAHTVNVVLIGHTGQVGSALLKRLNRPTVEMAKPQLELAETLNRSRHQRFRRHEVHDVERHSESLKGLVRRLRRAGRPAVVIDCTANIHLPEFYPEWLERGIGVVTPNKHGLAGDPGLYHRIQAAARFGHAPLAYSATVGAGLPILSTLARIARAGETPAGIEAVLSGTLVHVFGQLAAGSSLSEAVADAHRRGFTEPDPLEDLSGKDVERKLIIMLREAGLADVPVTREPLVDDDFGQNISPDSNVFSALKQVDAKWRDRVDQAARQGKRWIYLASFDGEQARVGPHMVDADSAFARLSGAGNLARITLRTDPDTPLEVFGPGAGIEVTASAVMADLGQSAALLGG